MKDKILGYLSSLFFGCHFAAAQTNAPIPWDRIGAKAGAQYQGDGLSIVRSEGGAVLRCVFQKLEGHATAEGLWLTSTAPDARNDRFRVLPCGIGREGRRRRALEEQVQTWMFDLERRTFRLPSNLELEPNLIRFLRPGLVEEYSVSMDGVRQDFVITQRPAGDGELRLELEIAGAQAELSAHGARLVLDHSGRKLAYSRLRVEDAKGRPLGARIEVASAHRMAVLVEDAAAVYPVRIDPTFSDDHWISLSSSIPGADGEIYAAVTDGLGNLYIGGDFKVVGDVIANGIAKWDGSTWSALGSGMGGNYPYGYGYNYVSALAVSGSNLYVGGYFATAGGTAATSIAKWNGSSWSPLGSGITGGGFFGKTVPVVYALAVSGTDLYAGGDFRMAGDTEANRIAKWDGSSWSALGSGIDDWIDSAVRALAVSGSDLYVGGVFITAGGTSANSIAKWNGSSWSALGSGLGLYNSVNALAVLGGDLYVGGLFTTAGGSMATNIAKWNGGSWSALGSGINGEVSALAVSGSDLFAGGDFTTAGGTVANGIAMWNGSNWSALGSGMGGRHPSVSALAVSGSDLYAGGSFTTAGGKVSAYVAKAVVYPPVLALEPDGSGGYSIRFSGVPGTAYRLQHAPALAGPWDPSAPQIAPASGRVEFRETTPAPGQTFYRAVQP